MLLVAISDTHGAHHDIDLPYGDILVHCGDFSNTGSPREIDSFSQWFGSQPHPIKLLVWGNHDLTLDRPFYDANWKRFHKQKYPPLPKNYWKDRGITTLTNEIVVVNGIKFWGHPALRPEYNYWAWEFDSWKDSDDTMYGIPRDVDVVITHSPPYGVLDRNLSGEHIGNEELLVHIHDRVRPRICIFGHVHNPGSVRDDNGTRYYNVSMVDENLNIAHEPLVLEIS